MWILIITVLLGPQPTVIEMPGLTVSECHAEGRRLEARYLTVPARSFTCRRATLSW